MYVRGDAGGKPPPPYVPPKAAPSFLGAVGKSISRVAPAVTQATRSASTPHQGLSPGPNAAGSPGHATTVRLARALAPSPQISALQGKMGKGNLQQRIATTTAFDSATNQAVARLAQNIWKNVQQLGYQGARIPPLKFDLPTLRGMDTRIPKADTTAGRVVEAPKATGAAVFQNVDGYPKWVAPALTHEFAHTMQNKAALTNGRALTEGGAQAWNDVVDPRLGFPAANDGAYRDYVQQVRAREPGQWVMQGQFTPGAAAPKVNMPGTPSFALAMGGVGRTAGIAARRAALRAGVTGGGRSSSFASGRLRVY